MSKRPYPDIPIVLASASPRRKQLLTQSGFSIQVVPSSVDEDFSIDLPSPDFARYYARKKAEDVSKQFPKDLVIGADTIVVLEHQILRKPSDREEAIHMLSTLSGQTHEVVTAAAMIWKIHKFSTIFHETTKVTFNRLSRAEIEYYVDTFRPFDKAGSYGIQDWFALNVRKVSGCFYNVVGFPLSRFYTQFKDMCDSLGIKVN